MVAQSVTKPQTKTSDISKLNENELFDKIQEYVVYLNNFAAKNRNVHKDIKETVHKTHMLCAQYRKTKNQRTSDKSKTTEKHTASNAATQTPAAQKDNPDSSITDVLGKIQKQLSAQQWQINQLVTERDYVQQQRAYESATTRPATEQQSDNQEKNPEW